MGRKCRIIQENPYRLADDMNGIGLSWRTRLPKKPVLVPIRIFESKKWHYLYAAAGTLSRHIYIPAHCWWRRRQMLGVEEEAVEHLLQSLQMDHKIICEEN